MSDAPVTDPAPPDAAPEAAAPVPEDVLSPGDLAAIAAIIEPIETVGDGDATREGVQFLAVGGARISWELPPGDDADEEAEPEYVTIRLRRPTFGEVKSLDRALVETTDEVSIASGEIRAQSKALVAEQDAIDEDDPDRADKLRDLRRRDRALAAEMTERSEALMLDWWLECVRRLAVGPTKIDAADDLPAWIAASPALPARLVQHFRRVPSVRG